MPIGDLLAQISGEPSPTLPSPVGLVRKAGNDIRKPSEGGTQRAKASVGDRSVQVPHSIKTQVSQPLNSNSMVKLAPSSNQRHGQTKYIPPTPKSAGPAAPATSTTTSSSKPPKKGSFAEIMARAKAAQANLGAVGKIQHKKIEKREREDIKGRRIQKLGKTLSSDKANSKPGQMPFKDERNSVRENSGKGGVTSKSLEKDKGQPEKKIKKAALATTGYTGTARPKPGSARLGLTSSSRSSMNGHRSHGYGGTSSSKRHYESEEEDEEEDEEDEGDEEEDYYSDASSDMEAAVFEVDEEEAYAERIARQEDAEALREEMRLKREKLEKKKRLIAMAKKARR